MWEPSGFLSKFTLRIPIILHGKNAFRGLRNLPASRIAIIHGSSFSFTQQEQIRNQLKGMNIQFFLRSWQGEPSLSGLAGTIGEIEVYRPDVIIAIGGGSVIDGAKLVRLFYEIPSFQTRNRSNNLLKLNSYFIAAPTTIGSGAEVSSAAVLYNDDEGTKEFIVLNAMLPEIVVLDSEAVLKAPKNLLYQSMLDAFAHNVEGYVSKLNNQVIDIYAEKSIQIINSHWDDIKNENLNTDSILQLQFASFLAGLVQNHCLVGAAHGLAHQLAFYKFSHASAVGMIIEPVMRMNSKETSVLKRYENLAKCAGIENGMEGLLTLCNFLKFEAELDTEFSRLKRLKNDILKNELFFEHASADAGGKGNPVLMTKESYKSLFDLVL